MHTIPLKPQTLEFGFPWEPFGPVPVRQRVRRIDAEAACLITLAYTRANRIVAVKAIFNNCFELHQILTLRTAPPQLLQIERNGFASPKRERGSPRYFRSGV